MSKILHITGGRKLSGTVRVAGAKNAATKMMIASLLTDQPVILKNCPQIEDVKITAEICTAIGAKISRNGHELRLETPVVTKTLVAGLSMANRLSILAMSPLLHRSGKAEVPMVGGDAIGPRPVNFHLDALAAMGAKVEVSDMAYIASAPNGLRGASIVLPYPSVGATENIIFAAVLAKGKTRIENAAIEPEITDIVQLLQQMGAIIEFGANRVITIEGVEKLHGATYTILPDRLEAASWGLVAIATDGEIRVEGARQNELISFLNTVRRIGGDYIIDGSSITFRRGGGPITAIELETDTYPGFATDWQQPLVVVLTQAKGLSVVHETVYEDRFGYTNELNMMGADIGVFAKCLGEINCRFRNHSQPHSAVIKGGTLLHGASITAPDIRAGMATVVAAMIARGESHIDGIHHLERGYEHFFDKLTAIGADFHVEEL